MWEPFARGLVLWSVGRGFIAAVAASVANGQQCSKRSLRPSYEYCIIGAGPGGLQVASLMEEDKRNYVLLERNPSAGTTFKKYPRHRQLISINKVATKKPSLSFVPQSCSLFISNILARTTRNSINVMTGILSYRMTNACYFQATIPRTTGPKRTI